MKKKNSSKLFIIVFVFFISTADAHAYIDPGSSSYIVQILIALILGTLYSVRHFLKRVIDYFSSFLKKNKFF